MRAFFDWAFASAGILIAAGLLSDVGRHVSPVAFGAGMAGLFLVLVSSTFVLSKLPAGKSRAEKYIEGLEEKGLLVSTEFRATRAFQVVEREDEGLHYFIELADGTVLYLTGRDLYDYEPIEDDFLSDQPRRFPCTEFALRTHRDKKLLVDIQCRGLVFEPAYVAPCPEDYWKWELEDGQIIVGEAYDEIKERIAIAAARPRRS